MITTSVMEGLINRYVNLILYEMVNHGPYLYDWKKCATSFLNMKTLPAPLLVDFKNNVIESVKFSNAIFPIPNFAKTNAVMSEVLFIASIFSTVRCKNSFLYLLTWNLVFHMPGSRRQISFSIVFLATRVWEYWRRTHRAISSTIAPVEIVAGIWLNSKLILKIKRIL